jgi:hypothetical protein
MIDRTYYRGLAQQFGAHFALDVAVEGLDRAGRGDDGGRDASNPSRRGDSMTCSNCVRYFNPIDPTIVTNIVINGLFTACACSNLCGNAVKHWLAHIRQVMASTSASMQSHES